MRRLSLIGSWKRLGIQAGLLGGLGMAFVGTQERAAEAGGGCLVTGQCDFKKPNFLIILDYSSSMHEIFQGNQTRWEAAVEAVQNLVTANNGYFDDRIHMALMRFGHDPQPLVAGTTIPMADPAIVDGQSLDIHWYDPANDPSGYFECNGQAIVDFLDNVDEPLCVLGVNGCTGIGTWTNGAMQFAQDVIAQTRADHPDDLEPDNERYYANLLVTDGIWTSPNGQQQAMPVGENPAITAGELCNVDNVDTYVVAFGAALGNNFADEIAAAGCTGQAYQAGAGQLIPALIAVVQAIVDGVIEPICISGLPRVMVILDASSSMLNVGGTAGAMGATGWDQAREALAGANSLFDLPSGIPASPPDPAPVVADVVHLGLTVFGSSPAQPAGAEERVLVDYGPCMQDNFAWALDPNTSCAAPGCNDPWSGPPIAWTFVGPGDPEYLNASPGGFDQDTYSHMPRCDLFAPGVPLCTGSATYTHRGLDLADANYHAYSSNPPDLYPADANTTYINILITDGSYATYSTDPQVQAELTHMYLDDGITTYVIGFGELTSGSELVNMACWGSGGSGLPCAGGSVQHFEAANQGQLEAALQTIIETLTFDPCCAFNNCAENIEPTTDEPDPQPPEPMTSSGPEPMTTDTGEDTMAITSGPTTGGVVDTGEPPDDTTTTGGDVVDDSGDAGSNSMSGSDSADATNTSPTTMTTQSSVTMTSSDDQGDTDTDGLPKLDDSNGCQCRADTPAPRGWLGGLFALGLLGIARRRRPAA